MQILTLLADTLPAGTEGTIGAVVGLLGGGGFSIWYGWYTTTKTMPAKDEAHQKAIKDIIDKFDVALREMKTDHKAELGTFWTELKEERQARRQDTTLIVEAIRNLSKPSP